VIAPTERYRCTTAALDILPTAFGPTPPTGPSQGIGSGGAPS
jgi:hypothetical protein